MNWPADYATPDCPNCHGTGIIEAEIIGEIGVAWLKAADRICDCVPAMRYTLQLDDR